MMKHLLLSLAALSCLAGPFALADDSTPATEAVQACPRARWICYVTRDSETYYGCGLTERRAYQSAINACDGAGDADPQAVPLCRFESCNRLR